MPYPLAVQLYSLREACAADLPATLAAVKAAGYQGVEAAGFHGRSAAEFRRLVEDHGLVVAASHSPWCRAETVQEAIDTAQALGLDVTASGFGRDDFADLAAVHRTCDTIAALVEKTTAAGLKLYLHNHAWEFRRFNGQIAHHIVAHRCPGVWFEVDCYWAANFGAENPAEQVKALRDRTIFLHIKDGPLTEGAANVAVGQGAMDLAACIHAARSDLLRWLIVELDRCDTDMLTAVAQSRHWLLTRGLCH